MKTETNTVLINNKSKSLNNSKHKSTLFYVLLMFIPVVQFILFYIVVNFKSFGYAFINIDVDANTRTFTLENFTNWFNNPSSYDDLISTLVMAFKYYGIMLCVTIPLGLLFAYYIFKKLPLSGFFRVCLFIPSIIPAAALVLSYKKILDEVTPVLFKTNNLMFNNNQFLSIIIYNLFVGFGTSVVMYANKMCDISPEIIEAGKLDGVSGVKEFIHIIFPLTYPTLSVFLITGIATIFANQYNLYLFNANADTRSIGYYLYCKASSTIGHENLIPEVAALGLILTAIAIPLTYGFKWLLEKIGPSED